MLAIFGDVMRTICSYFDGILWKICTGREMLQRLIWASRLFVSQSGENLDGSYRAK